MSTTTATAQPKPTHILIVGTGAVGAFYGSRLALAPHTLVSVTCRSNYAQVASSGLSLHTHSYGNYHFHPHAVFPSIAEAVRTGKAPRWDYIVVATKALPDVASDAELIAPLLEGQGGAGEEDQTETDTAGTTIVLIQNGVGVERAHRERFPRNVVLSAVTVVSAEQTLPGVVRQNRWTRISVGPFVHGDGEEGDAELKERSRTSNEKFVQLLREGGVDDAEEYDEVGLQLVRWHKLAINASMNPSSVLSGLTGNSLMSLDPDLRSHLRGCMAEILTTAPRVLGREWPDKLQQITPEKILKSSERNTEGLPSMLVDWREGRRMELEVILGNPIRLAQSKGIEMPRLQTMYALLKMAQRRRDEEKEKEKAKGTRTAKL